MITQQSSEMGSESMIPMIKKKMSPYDNFLSVVELMLSYDQSLTVQDRNCLYEAAGFPAMQIRNDRLEDVWWMGNSYGNKSAYYGAYPGNFLKRINTLFPDKKNILHLFSGSLPPGDYTRFDRRESSNLDPAQMDLIPESSNRTISVDFNQNLIRGEAERLSDYFKPESFDLIVADPPYSMEDAEHYGTTMVNRNAVVKQALLLLKEGGHLVWLDQVIPMYSNRDWKLEGSIGIFISTNHRARALVLLKKKSIMVLP